MANLTFNIDDDTKEIARQFIRAINGLAKVIQETTTIIKADRIETSMIRIKSEPTGLQVVNDSKMKFADGND